MSKYLVNIYTSPFTEKLKHFSVSSVIGRITPVISFCGESHPQKNIKTRVKANRYFILHSF